VDFGGSLVIHINPHAGRLSKVAQSRKQYRGYSDQVLQFPSKPERVQVAIEGPEHLHKKISIENSLIDKSGQEVQSKMGAKVTIKASPESIGL
jgi:hypothetical protein